MTVKELIAILETHPPDMQVVVGIKNEEIATLKLKEMFSLTEIGFRGFVFLVITSR